MKDLYDNKEEKEDFLKAKEEAKDFFNELADEQLKQVAGGIGDVRGDLSEDETNSEYVTGEVDVDGWTE